MPNTAASPMRAMPLVDRHANFVEHAANRRQNIARGLIHFRLER